MNEHRIPEIKATLQDAIRWAVDEGPGWDPECPVHLTVKNGRRQWAPWDEYGTPTGVCAIGALLCRLPKIDPDDWNRFFLRSDVSNTIIHMAAKLLNLEPLEVAALFYWDVPVEHTPNGRIYTAFPDDPRVDLDAWFALSQRLLAYGDDYSAEHHKDR